MGGLTIVDAHQHFWRWTPEEYGWIDDDHAMLRRDRLPADLASIRAAHGIAASVAVQARQSLAETEWLLALAHEDHTIAGVVGWLPLAAPDAADHVARAAASGLRGVRHVVQGEPAGFLDDPGFNRGVAAAGRHGLVYDLLVREHQLAEAIRFVDRHPQMRFVLDHGAKPRIRERSREPWRTHVCELARRPHVCCKLSGLPTEADLTAWTVDDLRPYVDDLLAAFGPQRLLWGSDWPVVDGAGGYGRWIGAVRTLLAPLSAAEQAACLGGTAAAVYRLEPSP